MPRSKAVLLFVGLAALAGCVHNDVLEPCPVAGILGDAETLTAFAPGAAEAPSAVMYHVTLSGAVAKCSYTEHNYPRGASQPTRMRGNESDHNPRGPGGPMGGGLTGGTSSLDNGVLIGVTDCQSDDSDSSDDQTGNRRKARANRADVDFRFDITVDRGAAPANPHITVPYFVAVTRGRKYILARQEFSRSLDLSDAQVGVQEHVPVTIPIAKGLNGASYEVVVGLILTPEQLGYNRKQHVN